MFQISSIKRIILDLIEMVTNINSLLARLNIFLKFCFLLKEFYFQIHEEDMDTRILRFKSIIYLGNALQFHYLSNKNSRTIVDGQGNKLKTNSFFYHIPNSNNTVGKAKLKIQWKVVYWDQSSAYWPQVTDSNLESY